MTLWSDLPSEGGALLGFIGPPYLAPGGRYRRRLTNDHELEFDVARTAPWIDDIRRGRVVRIATRGEIWWWSILHVTDELTSPMKQVYAVGIEDRLRAMGPVWVGETGQRRYYSAGYLDLVPHQAIDTFLVPCLQASGWSAIGRGTIESLMLHQHAWQVQSAREIMAALAQKVGCEWRLRYDTDSGDHLLEVLDEIGADAPPVYVATGRNITALARTQGQGDFGTALVPQGDTDGGTGERHGVSEASWYVSAKSTDVLTLAARNGGPGPVAFDNEWVPSWLLARDATFHEVVGSDAATQQVTLEAGGGASFAVGDEVVFYADDQGTPITELSNPAAVIVYGREAMTKAYEGYRSERQHVSNPFFARWPNKPDAVPCLTDGAITQSSSPVSASFDGLPPGRVVSAGDVFFFAVGPSGSPGLRGYRVTVGGTANGSGEVTVTVAGNPLGGTSVGDNRRCYHIRQAARQPEGWGGDGWIMARPAVGVDATGAADDSYTDAYEVALKNLDVDDGTEVAFGDLLETGSEDRNVIIGGTVTGGAVTVWLSGALTVAENATVTIKRPGLTGGAAYLPILMSLPQGARGGIATQIDSDSWTWRYRPGMLPLYFSCAVAVYGSGGGNPITYSTFYVRTTGGSTLESVQHPGGTNDPLLLSVGVELSADTSLLARLSYSTSISQTAGLFTVPIRCYAFEAPDELTPPIDGSHGTELVQRGHADLRRISVLPSTYQVRCVDLSELPGYAAEWERAVLGGRIMLRAAAMRIADTPRVVELDGSLDDPRDVQFILGTRPDLVSRQMARARPLPQFVSFTPPDGDGESVQAGSASMPTKVENAPRAVGSPGSAPTVVPPTPDEMALYRYNRMMWLTGQTLGFYWPFPTPP